MYIYPKRKWWMIITPESLRRLNYLKNTNKTSTFQAKALWLCRGRGGGELEVILETSKYQLNNVDIPV
jgi:hypothetical protein